MPKLFCGGLGHFDGDLLNEILPSSASPNKQLLLPVSAGGTPSPLERLRTVIRVELQRRQAKHGARKAAFARELRALALLVLGVEGFGEPGSIPGDRYADEFRTRTVLVLPVFWESIVVEMFGEELVRQTSLFLFPFLFSADFYRQMGGWVKTAWRKQDTYGYHEDIWMPFVFKFTPLEVLRMRVDHAALLDPNLAQWRQHMIKRAGIVAKEIYLAAFPEEQAIGSNHQMARMAVYADHLEKNSLWFGQAAAGGAPDAWMIGRTRGTAEPPAGTILRQVLQHLSAQIYSAPFPDQPNSNLSSK